jgi:hypothetical protein
MATRNKKTSTYVPLPLDKIEEVVQTDIPGVLDQKAGQATPAKKAAAPDRNPLDMRRITVVIHKDFVHLMRAYGVDYKVSDGEALEALLQDKLKK